jgi:hypothetical protein
MVATNQIKKLRESNLLLGDQPFSLPLELFQKHRENTQKFGSCPLRSKTLVFPGFFACWANCFGFLCLSMHVHACRCCPCRNRRLVRCLGPQKHFSESSSESLESSPDLRFPRENMLFCIGGAGFELVEFES